MNPEEKQKILSSLPSVDELLRQPDIQRWLNECPRKIIVEAARDLLASKRTDLMRGLIPDLSFETILKELSVQIKHYTSYSLRPVINATGIVIHTNLGRAVMSEKMMSNVARISQGYSNLEYDLERGMRGKRYIHTKRLLKQITGAEDSFIVNNNAAAVFLCLNSIAKGKEVIVSRGELVEIGGSFRVPDVMAASSAILKEVGTTNKTHLHDYEKAINENTGLLLKVHQSNYKITGFTSDVDIRELVNLGKRYNIPVMFDLGSGCLVDLRPYGIHSEPAVQEIIGAGVSIVTFSGDKLLGGPQGGIIAGKQKYIEAIQKNPLARALRVDKMTIAAFEAIFMEYMDLDRAKKEIPTLNMLLQPLEEIKNRARNIASSLRKEIKNAEIKVIKDVSKAGGGSLPEVEFPTFAISLRPYSISVNVLEEMLRKGDPPVIARIREDMLLLDARTIMKKDIQPLIKVVMNFLKE